MLRMFAVCLVTFSLILNSGCSKSDTGMNQPEIQLETYDFLDTTVATLILDFDLGTDKDEYAVGETVKIYFSIYFPPADDAVIYYKFKFSSKEWLGVDIFKDTTLVYHHPKTVTETPDSLLVAGGIPAILYHNWEQVDDSLDYVEPGEYKINAFLLDDNSPVKEKKIKILD